MSEEDSVSATLTMSLNTECPECDHIFDLFGTSFNDEGQLYEQVIADDRWKIDAEKRLDTYAYCPECSVEFRVKGVNW